MQFSTRLYQLRHFYAGVAGYLAICANGGPRYFECAIQKVEDYVQKAGPEGRDELNRVAWGHTMTLEPATKVYYSGCDIEGGKLRLLFNPKCLGK